MIRSVLYVSGANVFRRVITVLVQLILARKLGAGAFGDLTLAISIFVLMAGAGDLGTRLHAWRVIALEPEETKDSEAFTLLLRRSALVLGVVVVLNVLIAIFAHGRVGMLLHLYTVAVVFNQTTFDWFFLSRRRFREYLRFTVAGALIYVAGIVLLVDGPERVWWVPILLACSYLVPGGIVALGVGKGVRAARRGRILARRALADLVRGNLQLLVYDLLQRTYLVAIIIAASAYYSREDIARFQVPYLIYTFVVGLGVHVASGIFEKVARESHRRAEASVIVSGSLLIAGVFIPAGGFGADILARPMAHFLNESYVGFTVVLQVLVHFIALAAFANFAREAAVSAGDKRGAVLSYLVTLVTVVGALAVYHPHTLVYLAWVVVGAEAVGIAVLVALNPTRYLSRAVVAAAVLAYVAGWVLNLVWHLLDAWPRGGWIGYATATSVTGVGFLLFVLLVIRRFGLADVDVD